MAQLQGDEILPLVDMSLFAKPEWAGEAAHELSCSFSFSDTDLTFPIERENYDGENVFPRFTVDFVSRAGELIPLQLDEHAEDFSDLVRAVADQVPLCP